MLPKSPKIPFDSVNKLMTKREISNMIDHVYRHCGQKETVIFCDRIMALGFHHAFKAGISFGKDDMVVPDTKWKIVDKTRELAKEFEQQYNDGLITQGEKYNKVVDAWSKCTDEIADEMMKEISAVKKMDGGREAQVNSIYMMAHSGARGSPAQMQQLAGMRGLMAKPSGEIIETPDHLELQGRAVGARVLQLDPRRPQGPRRHRAEDRELRLPDAASGRRGAGLHHHAGGLRHRRRHQVRAIIDAGTVVASLATRILGRTTAEDVRDPSSHKVIVKKGTLLEEPQVEAIVTAGVQELRIRSVLTCEPDQRRAAASATGAISPAARRSTWARRSASSPRSRSASRAPSSPCARSTSAARRRSPSSRSSSSNFDGKIKIKNKNIVKNSDGQTVAMVRNMVVAVLDPDGTERAVHRIQYGARLLVDDGDQIKRGQRIAEWDPYTRPILTEVEGIDRLRGPGRRPVDVGDARRIDRHRQARGHRLAHRLEPQPAGPASGDRDQEGQQDPEARARRRGALPARRRRHHLGRSGRQGEGGRRHRAHPDRKRQDPRHHRRSAAGGGAVRGAAAEGGRGHRGRSPAPIRFGKDYKNKRRIIIEPNNKDEEPREYLIPKGKHIHLQDGDLIEKGDYIVEGNPAPHDILAIKGVEELAAYLVNEIQEVYRLQGVAINDKHIEVIVRQMLQKVEIADAGETDLIQGEQIDRIEFDEINARAVEEGKKPAAAHPVLLGITKASLQTRSFISAASFQETTRVLTEAAVNGKVDTLDGLKENVIVGRLIPAGTGAMMNPLREVAGKRDALILEEREKEAAAKAEAAKAAEQPAALPAAE